MYVGTPQAGRTLSSEDFVREGDGQATTIRNDHQGRSRSSEPAEMSADGPATSREQENHEDPAVTVPAKRLIENDMQPGEGAGHTREESRESLEEIPDLA